MIWSISCNTLKSHYPSPNFRSAAYVPREYLYKEIGWDEYIGGLHYANTCAVRVSVALARSGVTISPGSHGILRGEHKNRGVEANMESLAGLLASPRRLGD